VIRDVSVAGVDSPHQFDSSKTVMPESITDPYRNCVVMLFAPDANPNKRIVFPYSTDFMGGFSGNFTIDFWIQVWRPVDYSQIYAVIVNGRQDASHYSYRITVEFPSNDACIRVYGLADGGSVITSSSISYDEWHHIAIIREGTGTDEMFLYIDGNQDKNWTFSGSIANYNYQLSIGAESDSNSSSFTNFFYGMLQNVRIVKGEAYWSEDFDPNNVPDSCYSEDLRTPGYFHRGVFNGGSSSLGKTKEIEYITINTAGNSWTFGQLSTGAYETGAASNSTLQRAIVWGGRTTSGTIIDDIQNYVIDTLGNASVTGGLGANRSHITATSNGIDDRSVTGTGSDNFHYNYNRTDTHYRTISTNGDASSFGTMSSNYAAACASNGTDNRGVWACGEYYYKCYYYGNYNRTGFRNNIYYITISSPGNASNFGTWVKRGYLASCSNGVHQRMVMFGGRYISYNTNCSTNHDYRYDDISYVTINTTSNANSFGQLTESIAYHAACSSGRDERAIRFCGWNSSYKDTIDYFTINTLGNASHFGHAKKQNHWLSGTSNSEMG